MRLTFTDHPRNPRFDNADALTHHDRRITLLVTSEFIRYELGYTENFSESGVRYVWNELQIRQKVHPQDNLRAAAYDWPTDAWKLYVSGPSYESVEPNTLQPTLVLS